MESLHVDCDRCVVRGNACGQCVVSVLLDAPPALDFTPDERQAVANLAAVGLIPPVRMRVSRRDERRANGTDG
ncbi:hypothetical protein GCM10009785_18770 [Brooklawnia cerclae]|uniref:Uncharacterized protein n=1 Tax=Brooklawnia cerclae TaxID=349934 RepID=A0ABX0SHV3_9ACTN|nr:hypothetical protein [Brooklawnia cerclae]NIH57550.1 hypothetical protein [Brooklawnia cerclae]